MSDEDVKPIDFNPAQGWDTPETPPTIDHDRIAFGTSINRVRKGQEIEITSIDPTIVRAQIGIGWDLKGFEQNPLDLDGSVFLLDKTDKTRENADFVFYNNTQDRVGAVRHAGDSRTGAGDGDDETIHIGLTKLSYEVIRIVFVVSIYDPELMGYDFADVKNVYFRMVNEDSGHELFRFELEESMLKGGNALVVGALDRIGARWVFVAHGEMVSGGLAQIASQYGIVVAETVRA